MKSFLTPMMILFALLSAVAMLFMPFWLNMGVLACTAILAAIQYVHSARSGATVGTVLVLCLFMPVAALAADGSVDNSGDILGWFGDFFNSFPDWIVAITTVVSACTGITMLTPTKKDDKIVNSILSVLNVLAGNFGKNKNKDE
jgi:hypothetical protein